MSDDKKKDGGGKKPIVDSKRTEQRGHINANKTDGKTKIDIKGQGSGTRPKRDTEK